MPARQQGIKLYLPMEQALSQASDGIPREYPSHHNLWGCAEAAAPGPEYRQRSQQRLQHREISTEVLRMHHKLPSWELGIQLPCHSRLENKVPPLQERQEKSIYPTGNHRPLEKPGRSKPC